MCSGRQRSDRFMRVVPAFIAAIGMSVAVAADDAESERPGRDFEAKVRPFLESYCLKCHGELQQESELNLDVFTKIESVRAHPAHWELVLRRLQAAEMPPSDAPEQPTAAERTVIVNWIEDLRKYEADRNAGDPGPVLARRLNSSEYDYTIRDLTGVDLRPTREFPVDPANPAGFTNSGESLTMSPALFSRYLDAAEHVTSHLVLMPRGFAFAPHPVITSSDRDKFAVQRVIEFYRAQKTDLTRFLLAAWQFKHRDRLQESTPTLAAAAASHDISPGYLRLLWKVLHDGDQHRGPIAELRERWEALPEPASPSAEFPEAECRDIRDWIMAERSKRQFEFPLVMIPQLNPSTQPGVLWRNRLIAEHRRRGRLTEEEQQDEELSRAIERFCDIFPDRFMRTERGRMNLPFEKQNKGRLLSAGFHLQVGYYRDDAPLCDLVLDDDEKRRLDRLWHELNFVTNAPVRQFQDYIYFERAEGREIITEAEFDFIRGEDRSITSPETMNRFARLYVEAVRQRDLDEQAVAEIARFFVDLSASIQKYDRAGVEAEPSHLQALLHFTARAWRRPLSADESRQLLKDYRVLRELGELSHEQAIHDVMVSVLTSPFFCYRVDIGHHDDGRLTDFSLANRLSYFLWSSMPDEELWELAENRNLHRYDVLTTQVTRMLADDRARALAIEFGGYWLGFRQFERHVGVDRTQFPQFTDDLRQSMFEEPIRFVRDLIRRDGSVDELFAADHTFVDKNLAVHYQIPWSADAADADGWMRVDNAPEFGRGGLLPMAVFLTQSSPGLRTSPVKRGYWVIRQLLGERIPPPPADVPELPRNEAELGDLTLRELLEQHRSVESCAACHAKFDFAGLVFEAYGPIGERRTQDLGGKPVDESTVFPDGTPGRGLPGLRAYLLEHRQPQFEDNLCRKLLAYGLGRSLLLSDESLIDQMKQVLQEQQGSFHSLILTIVTSPQFLNKRIAVAHEVSK